MKRVWCHGSSLPFAALRLSLSSRGHSRARGSVRVQMDGRARERDERWSGVTSACVSAGREDVHGDGGVQQYSSVSCSSGEPEVTDRCSSHSTDFGCLLPHIPAAPWSVAMETGGSGVYTHTHTHVGLYMYIQMYLHTYSVNIEMDILQIFMDTYSICTYSTYKCIYIYNIINLNNV